MIDDDAKKRKYLPEMIRKKGYNMLTEQSGEKGYTVAKEKKPDLIIVGAVIAGNKSVGLCAKLKNDSKTRHIPVLVLSDSSRKNIKSIEYYDKGVDFFLTSPIAEGDLLKQIEILIGK